MKSGQPLPGGQMEKLTVLIDISLLSDLGIDREEAEKFLTDFKNKVTKSSR